MRIIPGDGGGIHLKDPVKRAVKSCKIARLSCIRVVRTLVRNEENQDVREVCGNTAKTCEHLIVAMTTGEEFSLDACLESLERAIVACQSVKEEVCDECADECEECIETLGKLREA